MAGMCICAMLCVYPMRVVSARSACSVWCLCVCVCVGTGVGVCVCVCVFSPTRALCSGSSGANNLHAPCAKVLSGPTLQLAHLEAAVLEAAQQAGQLRVCHSLVGTNPRAENSVQRLDSEDSSVAWEPSTRPLLLGLTEGVVP